MFIFPMSMHQGMRTVDTCRITMARYLNLNPVQGRTTNFIEQFCQPFKHAYYSLSLKNLTIYERSFFYWF